MGASARLRYFLDEHREFIIYRICRGASTPQVHREFYDKFPEAYVYSVTAFYKYLKTSGKEALDEAKEEIREEAKEVLVASREGRTSVLAELAGQLIAKLYGTPDREVGNRIWLSWSKELRETFREIRAEMEPFGEVGAGLDLFTSLVASFQKVQQEDGKLPDFLTRAIEGSTIDDESSLPEN